MCTTFWSRSLVGRCHILEVRVGGKDDVTLDDLRDSIPVWGCELDSSGSSLGPVAAISQLFEKELAHEVVILIALCRECGALLGPDMNLFCSIFATKYGNFFQL
jgi:hypothetical protein